MLAGGQRSGAAQIVAPSVRAGGAALVGPGAWDGVGAGGDQDDKPPRQARPAGHLSGRTPARVVPPERGVLLPQEVCRDPQEKTN